MSEIAGANNAEVSITEKSAANTLPNKLTRIRVSPNSYFIALFLATFFSGFLVYLEIDWAALSLFVLSWILIPVFLYSDRIVFDGKRLYRTGTLPNIWAFFNNSRTHLKLSDVEQIETQSLRALKRGGNVFYRYRTSVRGKDVHFAFASGGEDYRSMIAKIFPRLSENVLDNRSLELRDYLSEPKETLMKAEFNHIPSVEVLENSINDFGISKKTFSEDRGNDESERERAEYLRNLANELRLSGYLLQALETFRRASLLNPRDGWLLFEFARCLHSFASSEKDKKLERKSLAMLRLAERYGESDSDLLARLGESYFQFGNWERAKTVFQKVVDATENSFRSVRGLAEISLREGKIAHVIHNFSNANRLAETPALRRWTQNETDYFSRLNSDEDYMEMEISRVNMLETLENSKKTAIKIALFSFPAILMGVVVEDALIANIGWAVSIVSLLIWTGLMMSQKLLSARIPFEIFEEDDE